MTEEIKSRLNWLYAVEGTEKERAALFAISDLAFAWALRWPHQRQSFRRDK